MSPEGGQAIRPGAPPATVPRRADPPDDPPVWGRDAADQVRIAFQQPFQLAFGAAAMLRSGQEAPG